MNTVKNAIWGEGNSANADETAGTEPVSGEMGNTAAGEPYDAGNMNREEGNHIETTQGNSTFNDPALSALKPIDPSSSGTSTAAPTTSTTNTYTGRATSETGRIQTGRDTSTGGVAASSAGAGDVETATENAGGIQMGGAGGNDKSRTTDPLQEAKGQQPAKEMKFTKQEIDAAANVNTSHENPHTIGSDGNETIEEIGGAGDQEGGAEDKDGKPVRKKEGKMGTKIEKIKEKLHIGGK